MSPPQSRWVHEACVYAYSVVVLCRVSAGRVFTLLACSELVTVKLYESDSKRPWSTEAVKRAPTVSQFREHIVTKLKLQCSPAQLNVFTSLERLLSHFEPLCPSEDLPAVEDFHCTINVMEETPLRPPLGE